MDKRWYVAVMLSVVFGIAASPTQKTELNALMRVKLAHAQKILEAVVTNDWVGLETHSRELERLTHDPAWTVLTFPDYAKHSAAFVRTLQDLHRAAAQRDTEKTPKAYIALTLRCVECHRYLARERFAQ